MRLNEKAVIRKSILDLCNTGLPRQESTDDVIRKIREKNGSQKEENLWEYIVALGAQLSRPPFDPYREKIKLTTKIGRKGDQKISLKIPILIYGEFDLSQSSKDALNLTLNDLDDDRSTVGLISKDEPCDERKYPHFQILDDINKLADPDGIVLKYTGAKTEEKIEKIRKEFDGPILVEVDEDFSQYVESLLELGIDGILVNTENITKSKRYNGKHAIAVIHDARLAINEFYRGKENDGACLVVAGDVNNAGKMIKAAGLGADIIGYDTSLLIAKVGHHSENFFDEEITAQKIFNHMIATKSELTGIPAALGYSDFHNMSPGDFRTSSIKASVQGDIPLEGVDKTYRNIVEEILDEYVNTKNISVNQQERQKIINLVIEEEN
ncbi:MAG: hypothetical protein OEW78_10020 [Nitrosopumilus sp.]|uniref:hypothetical protein n=1 Tax=Nitrosopumilus sp. TaxID=2024843 RepID=UPI00246D8C1A|nr:hypothetical protein [Nitrosopumilus sp.]MDH5432194.1 hypothetical protein [Nitrosopumilus sp.]